MSDAVLGANKFGERVLAWDTGVNQGSVAYEIAAPPEPRARGDRWARYGKIICDETASGAAARVGGRAGRNTGHYLHARAGGESVPQTAEARHAGLRGTSRTNPGRPRDADSPAEARPGGSQYAPRPLNTFKTKSMICDRAGGKRLGMANLLPSRFLGELDAAGPKPIAGGA